MSLPVARTTRPPIVVVGVLALMPVMVAADTAPRALGLAAAVVATLSVLRAADRLLGAQTTDALRLCTWSVLASATVALLGLLGAAYLPAGYLAVKSQLPLVAASSLLLSGVFTLPNERAGPGSRRAELTTVVAAALALVAVGVLRHGLSPGVELAKHPAGALLVVGLGLAAANHWRSRGRATGTAQ
jgi:Na+-translocating ferredoxin:NAD+ oxidoreductase RnfE subunit